MINKISSLRGLVIRNKNTGLAFSKSYAATGHLRNSNILCYFKNQRLGIDINDFELVILGEVSTIPLIKFIEDEITNTDIDSIIADTMAGRTI